MKRKPRIAINGLGRIGRTFLRQAWGHKKFDIVAIGSRSEASVYAHLLKYDSAYGIWDKEIEVKRGNFIINGKLLPFIQKSSPDELPWKKLGIDLVVESTGKFRTREEAMGHIEAGAKKVVVTAPMEDADGTFVMGVNDDAFDPKKQQVVSAASCTSVCSALVVNVLEERFGIERGFISTVHAFTSDQELHDSARRDLRRARAATESIIPTSTGVTSTIDKLYPRLRGKLSGMSLRVPVLVPSVISFAATLKRRVTKAEVNRAFTRAAAGRLAGHLDVSNKPLVSVDFKNNPHGAIVDLLATDVVDGKLANVLAWYDNEAGYVSQLVQLVARLGSRL